MSADAVAPSRSVITRPWFWVMFVGLMVAVPVLRAVSAPKPQPLPTWGQVPQFQLTSEQGVSFGSNELKGRVWVANFIFTRCPTVCPTFTAKMASIASKAGGLGDQFHLVSFTVDPEHDTPERLKEYGRNTRANPRQWSFLTGPMPTLQHVIVDGLRQPMDRGQDDDLMSYVHGGYFVLVDSRNEIRGYYAAQDAGSIDAVLKDAARLLDGG